jgi:hypothetical protein
MHAKSKPDPKTAKIKVAFFANKSDTAVPKIIEGTLQNLCDVIHKPVCKTKDDLPLLKMAIFGNKRSDKSLRNDDNVINITGAELDYDGEKVSFDQAVEMVKAMGICALVYTSPRHTAAAPRWRVLAPTSQPREPDLRVKLVARMNGFMGDRLGLQQGGILEKHAESFTLSQSYYYGRTLDNVADEHQAVVIDDGKFIDLAVDELTRFQKRGEKPDTGDSDSSNTDNNAFTDAADQADAGSSKGQQGTHGFAEILKEIGDGIGLKGFNDVLTRAVASYVGLHRGHDFDHEKLKQLLREAIEKAPKASNRNPKDIPRYLSDHYLDACITSAIRKFTETLPITINDFIAYLPSGEYIFILTRMTWVGKSINSRIPPIPVLDQQGRPKRNHKKGGGNVTQKPTQWLDQHRAVEQMTWAPGEPMLIKGKMVVEGAGWVKREGTQTFNLYMPPTLTPGNPNDAALWVNHIRKIYPDDADHIIKWLAHRVQFPSDKINHALMLGGAPGIGKDTILEPVKRAIGYSNFREVNPSIMLKPFNSYLRSVILRISEVRDLGETSRYAFNEHMKVICASPPDTLRINEKNIKEHDILNCCGVIMTTNHKSDGIYLPRDDRRTYVAWSILTKDEFTEQYWKDIWAWYDHDGDRNVMAYLKEYDLSGFNAKAPPLKTEAFHSIVAANLGEGESGLADILDQLERPPAVTLDEITAAAAPDSEFVEWLEDKRKQNHRLVPARMEAVGYSIIINNDAKDKSWSILGKRRAIYGPISPDTKGRIRAAQALIDRLEAAANNPPPIHPWSKG